MEISQLKSPIIIRGAMFPEPVQIIVTIPVGDAIKLIGKGIKSGKVFEPIMSYEQIKNLEASPETTPYTGDPVKFRLGIEALRLSLAMLVTGTMADRSASFGNGDSTLLKYTVE